MPELLRESESGREREKCMMNKIISQTNTEQIAYVPLLISRFATPFLLFTKPKLSISGNKRLNILLLLLLLLLCGITLAELLNSECIKRLSLLTDIIFLL